MITQSSEMGKSKMMNVMGKEQILLLLHVHEELVAESFSAISWLLLSFRNPVYPLLDKAVHDLFLQSF